MASSKQPLLPGSLPKRKTILPRYNQREQQLTRLTQAALQQQQQHQQQQQQQHQPTRAPLKLPFVPKQHRLSLARPHQQQPQSQQRTRPQPQQLDLPESSLGQDLPDLSSESESDEFCDKKSCDECNQERALTAAWKKQQQQQQQQPKLQRQHPPLPPPLPSLGTYILGAPATQSSVPSPAPAPTGSAVRYRTRGAPSASPAFLQGSYLNAPVAPIVQLYPVAQSYTPTPISSLADTGNYNIDANTSHHLSGAQQQHLVADLPLVQYTEQRLSRMNSIKWMPTSYRLALSLFLAEFIGVFILIVIGDGALASFVLTKQKPSDFIVCLGFGVGAMVATFASWKVSGAHINPAATVAFAIRGDIKWKFVPVYLVAQYLGGFVGALMLLINYSEAINYLDNGHRIAHGNSNATGWIFSTYPGPYVTPWGALLDQIIGTGVLLFSISALIDKKNMNLEPRHQPIIVALIITMTCVAFNPNCGAIFNPARDLAPRFMTYLFGWGPAVWEPVNGYYWFLAGVLGPHIGAILGVYAYRLFIGMSLDIRDEYEPGQHDTQLDEAADTKDRQQHNEDAKYGSTLRQLA